jgi:hypothetical protein
LFMFLYITKLKESPGLIGWDIPEMNPCRMGPIGKLDKIREILETFHLNSVHFTTCQKETMSFLGPRPFLSLDGYLIPPSRS